MSDIIRLLPDSVANQIAAGEVVQRPASVVKELLENSIDADSSVIKLIVKDAGKTLIQVIDNGKGMSMTDARMCFERHATSKISKAEDIFSIRSKGFRGEALASIAAVAQVEMKTKDAYSELGTHIVIEASEVKKQEITACAQGTNIAVKNLFFNVPARRNFLKSNPVELKHIIDEFERVAIPHYNISFTLQHNDNVLFNLPASNLKQRIINIFGDNFNDKILPVEETTNYVSINGFIGKADSSKKIRGEQYFFVNQRFIKSSYLNHAVVSAYSNLIAQDSFVPYFIFINIEPKEIDVNIHPTKTEIKFKDERTVYSILHASIKKSLGKYNIVPSLDFEQLPNLKIDYKPDSFSFKTPTINVNQRYNPFDKQTQTEKSNLKNWQNLYTQPTFNTESQVNIDSVENKNSQLNFNNAAEPIAVAEHKFCFQIQKTYIAMPVVSGLMLIHQQRAHERVLFERFVKQQKENENISSQQELFPTNIILNNSDYEIVREILPNLKKLGFDLHEFGKNTFVINGIPAEAHGQNVTETIEKIIETYKASNMSMRLSKEDLLLRALARSLAIKTGKSLQTEEMITLINDLFACEQHEICPYGKKIIVIIKNEELNLKFG